MAKFKWDKTHYEDTCYRNYIRWIKTDGGHSARDKDYFKLQNDGKNVDISGHVVTVVPEGKKGKVIEKGHWF